MPRYELLLKELLQLTVPEHVDHEHIQEAYDLVRKITTQINENKKSADMQKALDAELEKSKNLMVKKRDPIGDYSANILAP
jgi:hypothetical protein